jgi:hypothetical protein
MSRIPRSMTMRMAVINVLGFFLLLGASAGALAADAARNIRDAPWQFNIKGYGWLPEAPVDIKINQEEVANLPESFDNILPRDGPEPVVRWLWGARWGAL